MPELEMDDTQLASALVDLGAHLAYPERPSIRTAVLRRIDASSRPSLWGRIASPRRGLAPALIALALILVAVLASVPAARATAQEILRLRGVEIFRGPTATASPTRAPTATSAGAALGLGDLVSLDEAARRLGHPLLVPSDQILGAPDEVYVFSRGSVTEVSLVYLSRPGIPPSPQAHVAALVSEVTDAAVQPAFFAKVAGQATRIDEVTVNDGPGYWLEGEPHDVFYQLEGTGGVIDEQLRLAGNTLLWEQSGVLVRMEAQVDKTTALRIASSFR
ncbi:MAG: hypothetical protein KGN00_00335 [Chloroflexota bacterium]|nr:hypothetical protein [Chloroflexota bacterium]